MNPAPLDILFRDDHFVAINKPSGLLVHKSPIDKHETRFALQEVRNQINQHVFPVHRLDKPTSGVLLFALNPEAARLMCNLFESHQITKIYAAIVRGQCTSHGLIDHAFKDDIDHHAGIHEDRPLLDAKTHYRALANIELPYCVDRYPTSRYSLIECKPLTGRKHQIRRHLKHINHPIIGDAKHGKSKHNLFFAERYNVRRLLLAATQLEFTHPITQAPVVISANICNQMQQIIQEFGWQNSLPSHWINRV